jgi:hypothetical protein
MTEPNSSSSAAGSTTGPSGMTIDIRPMIEDVSQVMTKHITSILSGVIGEYTVYKETHDTIMGLPCVRKLQHRIAELESRDTTATATATEVRSSCSNNGPTREELQAAIVDLNRYIHALETKVNSVAQASSFATTTTNENEEEEEETVRLEIHEDEDEDENDDGNAETEEEPSNDTTTTFIQDTNSKNVIISTIPEEAEEEEAEEEAEEQEAEEEAVEEEEAEEEAAEEQEAEEHEAEEQEAEEEAVEEEEAEEEAAEEQEAEEEAVEEEEAEEEAVEEEAVEEEAVEEEAEEAAVEAADEAEIEVSEVKIKGKTYFTTDPLNGIIYACVDDDVGDEVGVFKNGVAMFNKAKK